jgi:hypothetical protein
MASVRSYVFMHPAGGPVPAGLLVMTDEPRNRFATSAYSHPLAQEGAHGFTTRPPSFSG